MGWAPTTGCGGGELLVVDGASFERVGHLRPLRQPGGDVAARQPWRMGAAALHALGRGDEILGRFGTHGASATLVAMLDKGTRAPWTTSCGRLFDAACGLLGVRPVATFEGEAPMVLESLVSHPRVEPGTWVINGGVLDLLPLLARLVDHDAADGADLFHGTLAAALTEWAAPAAGAHGGVAVLSGGCLMNRALAELLVDGLAARGVTALLPRLLPANDGGLCLGQAWVAHQRLQRPHGSAG